jgi:hypothetical protein
VPENETYRSGKHVWHTAFAEQFARLGMIFVTLGRRTAGRTYGDVTRTPEIPYCGSS